MRNYQSKLLKMIILSLISLNSFGLSIPNSVKTNSQAKLISGLELDNRDLHVRKQDDFYQYVNGNWIDKTEIPADKSSWGSFYEVRESTVNQMHSIVNDVIASKAAPGTNQQKIADIYLSFMDESALDQLGIKPLQPLLDKVNTIQTINEIPSLMAELAKFGVGSPYGVGIHQDARDSTVMVADIYQDGLGLPDRDYYLKTSDKNMQNILTKYQQYIARILKLAGDNNSDEEANDVIQIETKLAEIQWTKVANRDPVKTYNKYPLKSLSTLAPNYPWKNYLSTSGVDGKITYIIVSQPSYIKGFSELLSSIPLNAWKSYFRFHTINSFASDLSRPFVDENFAFYGTVLRGVPQNQPRWKRGIGLVEGSMGEVLGKLYVQKYFPPENKARMKNLVGNLIAAYDKSIESLDWMSGSTKIKAKEKLHSIMLKIGYPDHWRDYSSLVIKPHSLINNIWAVSHFNYQYEINKLGKPVDRSEWGMSPQTVNAYYNPELNEIVFPAGILQPPFFNVKADDAVNYGAIGAIIGHEISHGFDDQGSQYDAKGNLIDWFTKEDHKKFKAKTEALVKQYNAYSPLPGYFVNGELTLGENIADNSGLDIAYKAYMISLRGESAPVLDNMTGLQRLYFSWASGWRNKTREAQQIVLLKSDPHSPAAIRGNATLRNQPGFYKAFEIKPSDKMYLAPDKRVTIW